MATKPPYPDGSLAPPLKPAQRTAMIAWMEKNDPIWKNGGQGLGSGTYGPLAKQSDANLIYLYDNAIETLPSSNPVSGTIDAAKQAAQNANPLSSIGDFLNAIMSAAFWIRAAEVIGGLILITVGLNHLAIKQLQPVMSNPVVKQAIKVA